MYREEMAKQAEIEHLSKLLKEYDNTKKYGPELIKEFEDKMERQPERMQELQFKINTITTVLMNYEQLVSPLAARLNALMG